ncbi:cytochrome P450 [Penicillium lagena]|uniref:cytochrome P450 n=1 Tax=Penicillium lagena TaxID=94218 RepID=UPI002540172A|nr:cytochrome P450 [Penicillium lagena]KAJ5625301.1 cytochrome P450 [Penicillium lagena]
MSSCAGFGVKLPFQNVVDATMTSSKALFRDTQLPPHGYQFTFRSVMEYLNKNLMSVFFANWIIPQWIPRGMLPFWKRDFYAYDDLVKYFRALISSTDTSQSSPPNLLEEMVRSQLDNDKGQERGLSDWELQGNMFVFIIAGHETTATALRFALVLLAIDQEIQNWMSKDILEVIRSEPVEPAKWDYNALFPKLVTLLCVMLETLRLYPPAVTVPKWTGESPAEIVYDGQHYLLPAHTGVNLNAVPLHYASEYWGPNAINFDPSRWDKRNTKSFLAENGDLDGLTAPGLEYNTIHKPIRGAYFPFADGNRACLGKKFAQTEFVATLAVIFREFQVKLARNKDETEEAAIQRAKKVLNESSSLITLAMRDAVPLQFIKRW